MDILTMKRKVAFVMSGIPSSGKSTWVRQHMDPEVDVHISRDEIRFALLNAEDEYFKAEDKVKQFFYKQIEEYTSNGFTDGYIFIDATHLSLWSRKQVRAHIAEGVYTVAIDFDVDIKTALERNAQRSGRAVVPENVIYRMYGQHVVPTLGEGFDEIWHMDKDGRLAWKEKMSEE